MDSRSYAQDLQDGYDTLRDKYDDHVYRINDALEMIHDTWAAVAEAHHRMENDRFDYTDFEQYVVDVFGDPETMYFVDDVTPAKMRSLRSKYFTLLRLARSLDWLEQEVERTEDALELISTEPYDCYSDQE